MIFKNQIQTKIESSHSDAIQQVTNTLGGYLFTHPPRLLHLINPPPERPHSALPAGL